ncbi:MAG: TIGR03013 family PEP-CTERM/XrtA system glycosyltransferase [Rhodoferax sp.]|nr:TIGR03013 family PEP-CTERM/XrtA system glycosyltransferase [Rhodoferax sp.]
MIRIFNHYFYKPTVYQISFDMGLVICVVVTCFLYQAAEPLAASNTVLSGAFLMATGVSTINTGLGFYQRVQNRTKEQMRRRALFALCLSLPLAYAVFLLSPLPPHDEKSFAMALLVAMGLMLVHRTYMARTLSEKMNHTRVLVYGAGPNAVRLGDMLRTADPHVDLVGYYANSGESLEEGEPPGRTPSGKSLTEIVRAQRVQEIVVAVGERRGGSMPLRELLDCKLHGVRVLDSATYFEKAMGQIRRDSVSAGWLIFGDGFDKGPFHSALKRLFDIIFATFLLVLTLPLTVVTAVLIFLEGGVPVLYRQERVGLYGRTFNVVKFRSMRTDAEKDGTPRWASTVDDRVTRVGRIIRKLRIDELPQLFNVLAGDMSMVGPRPERPFFVNKLTHELPYYAVRHSIKPGITGWAQVRYHYGASVEDAAEKLQYDLYYVKNHTIFLDLVVLIETVGVVLTGKGAQ